MLVLPARATPKKEILTNINYSQERAVNFKVELRETAKTLPYYHTCIEIEPLVSGRSDNGKEIPINTVGRWLFGVPGYMGNAVFDAFRTPAVILVPECTPQEAIEMLLAAAEMLRQLPNN